MPQKIEPYPNIFFVEGTMTDDFPIDPLPPPPPGNDIAGGIAGRITALRLKLLEDMEILAGAIFVPSMDDDEDGEFNREAVVMVATALNELAEAFVELR